MNTDYLETLLRALDPAKSSEPSSAAQARLWQEITNLISPPVSKKRIRRMSIGAGLLSSLMLVIGVTTALEPSSSAVAAILQRAASNDAGAARFPRLASTQSYHQSNTLTFRCEFSSPLLPENHPWLSYITVVREETWIDAAGEGRVSLQPTALNGIDSHFATPSDQSAWELAGKPFVPCATSNSTNSLASNASNIEVTGVLGGFSSSVEGYGGFGLSGGLWSASAIVSAGANIESLPNDAGRISQLLADGQIDELGAMSPIKKSCPVQDGSNVGLVGCTPSEELALLEKLLVLPGASEKLGAALYRVVAELPTAQVIDASSRTLSATVSTVQVPIAANEVFQLSLDNDSGSLISTKVFALVDGALTPIAAIDFGAISAVTQSNQ